MPFFQFAKKLPSNGALVYLHGEIRTLIFVSTPFASYGDAYEFRFNDPSAHEGHLRQNDGLTWFCSETAIMIVTPLSYVSNALPITCKF